MDRPGNALGLWLTVGLLASVWLLAAAAGCAETCGANQRMVYDPHSREYGCEDRDPRGGKVCTTDATCDCACAVNGAPAWLTEEQGPAAGQRVQGRCSHYPPDRSGTYCFVRDGVAVYLQVLF
jgi:hypothetical protein